MSLNEVSLASASLRQYIFKLKGYSTLSFGLLMAQIFALFSSFGGMSGSMSSGSEELRVSVSNYSGNIAIAFTLIWIVIMAITLTTKLYRNRGFTLVTNRVSDNLSNIGVLLTACVFGGTTASLSGVLLRVIMYFTFNRSQIVTNGFHVAYSDLLLGMAVSVLYLVLVAAIGYLIGILTQIHIIFAILIPALLVGLPRTYTHTVQSIIEYYVLETVPLLFALKIIITAMVLFGLSVLLSNRMEVRE